MTCVELYEICESKKLQVTDRSDGLKLDCGTDYQIRAENDDPKDSIELKNDEDFEGEYTCETKKEGSEDIRSKILVKIRTCDNCIELDSGAIAGIAVGEVVATIVIGVAVYLVASKAGSGPAPTNKKSSDRQHLVPNEVTNRPTNDHYQPLRTRGGQRDTYDVLAKR
ncbi:T-cell surface glycoprotein CD3 gamma chain-like [Acanthochromis polyacanthus]|uniref:T-cell surface glycoprotein CD3 gamma chain-like n=1 Tax=Acanthochromis polyacanthus TaxID=80966 RepID=UPI002233F105|nr:T-cell surface glycoprotein CD3 gamma chain-like [Acanthochromis polyacanthus]